MTVGAQIWVLTWILPLDQRVARISLLPSSWINYAELEFSVSSIEDVEIEASNAEAPIPQNLWLPSGIAAPFLHRSSESLSDQKCSSCNFGCSTSFDNHAPQKRLVQNDLSSLYLMFSRRSGIIADIMMKESSVEDWSWAQEIKSNWTCCLIDINMWAQLLYLMSWIYDIRRDQIEFISVTSSLIEVFGETFFSQKKSRVFSLKFLKAANKI